MNSEMPSNASQLDEVICGPYNRRGLLCGEGKDVKHLSVVSAKVNIQVGTSLVTLCCGKTISVLSVWTIAYNLGSYNSSSSRCIGNSMVNECM